MELMKAYKDFVKHLECMFTLTRGPRYSTPFHFLLDTQYQLRVLELLLNHPINTLNEDIKEELLAEYTKDHLGPILNILNINIQELRSNVRKALDRFAMQKMPPSSQKDKLIEVLTRLVNPTAPAAVRAAAGASAASTKRSGEGSRAASAGSQGAFAAAASGDHEVLKHNNLGK